MQKGQLEAYCIAAVDRGEEYMTFFIKGTSAPGTRNDILMGDYSDDIWSPNPSKPWQTCLAIGDLVDPLLATPHQPTPHQPKAR